MDEPIPIERRIYAPYVTPHERFGLEGFGPKLVGGNIHPRECVKMTEEEKTETILSHCLDTVGAERECPECEEKSLMLPDDYLCWACRDGVR